MKQMQNKLWIAAIIGIITCLIVSLLEKKFSGLSITSAIFTFLVTINVNILIQLFRISEQLKTREMIYNITHPLLKSFAVKLMKQYEKIFIKLNENIIHFDSESTMMYAYYEVMLQEHSKKILATSMVDIKNVWESVRGQKAIDENKKLILNGVIIDRIFIFAGKEKLDSSEGQDMMKKQKEIGVNVSWVLISDLSAELRRDFLVTDSNVTLEYLIDPNGQIIECILGCNEELANEFRDKFIKISQTSRPF